MRVSMSEIVSLDAIILFFATASIISEGHAQFLEKGAPFFIGACGGDNSNVHTANLVNAVVVNLWENQLLAQTQGVVTSTIKATRANASKVSDARQGLIDEAIGKGVHPR